MAVRPSREEHHHLSLVTSPVADHQVTLRVTGRSHGLHAGNRSRIRPTATDPDQRRLLPRRPGQWLWQRE